MNEKPTRWEYITTFIVLLLCAVWAWYDYQNDPDKKIPFEPLIAVVSYTLVLLGYLRWKKNKDQQNAVVVEQKAEKIYNTEKINTAHFGTIEQQTNINAQYITYGETKIPRFLTQKPFNTNFFIGRDTDLADIETDYQKNNHLLVLVNGEGGMGKTTLAAQYWFLHEARYTHLAWVFADRGIGNALISLSGSLGVSFGPNDNESTQIIRITEAINNLDAPCLLIFDNANDATDLEKHFVTLRRLSNCQVLLTSRVTKVADARVHRVLPLSRPDAVRIFKKHYPKHTDTEDILLDKLLPAVGSNTLVIELLAKNLAMFNDFDTTYRLETLVSDLQDKGLFALQNEIVDVVYQSDALRKETPENIIAAMYDLSALPDDEKQMLSNFALLPAENIPFHRLKDLLKPTDSPTFKNTLRALRQKGWIDYFETTGDFKISPVIQHITKLKSKTTLLDNGKTLIDTLIDYLHPDNINDTLSAIFSRYAETVVAAFDAPNYNAALLCERIGTYYTTIGNLDSAIAFYEKCRAVSQELCVLQPDNEYNKNELAISYQFLGNTHTSLGNLDKALGFYEEYNHLAAALYAANQNNVEFKNGLAISYSKLGNTHISLGNLDKALGFYEEYNRLAAALYAANPNNTVFKNGLAISYQFLGKTHTNLDNLDKALGFYEEQNKLFEELYAVNPNNVAFKNGLAISYSKLGETHTILGNLDKALAFYKERNKLSKELYIANQNNVEFKNGLAISYSKLGNTHTSLGNLDKALEFYEEDIKLSKELYAANPNNVEFKNGLAVSYAKLGVFSRDQLKSKKKARTYFKQAETLWLELMRDAPQFIEYKKFLGMVQDNLKDLD
jgi:tetratricopeptide (TPR) repeat protein